MVTKSSVCETEFCYYWVGSWWFEMWLSFWLESSKKPLPQPQLHDWRNIRGTFEESSGTFSEHYLSQDVLVVEGGRDICPGTHRSCGSSCDGTNKLWTGQTKLWNSCFKCLMLVSSYQVGQRSFQVRRCSFQVESTSVSRQISQSSGGCQVSGYAANEGGV